MNLDDLKESERWHVGVLLEDAGVAHRWDGVTLVLPESAVEIVEGLKAEQLGTDTLAGNAASSHADEIIEGAPIDDVPQPSPPLRRLGAWLIDAIVVVAVTVPIGAAWSTTTSRLVDRRIDADGRVLSAPFRMTVIEPAHGAVWLSGAIIVAYHVIGVAVFGRTLGKWALGLRISGLDGSPTGWIGSVVRFVVATGGWFLAAALPAPHGTSGVLLSLLLVYVWPAVVGLPVLVDPGRRGLHDRAAKAVVTCRPRRRIRRSPLAGMPW